jgi:hypothetical protein
MTTLRHAAHDYRSPVKEACLCAQSFVPITSDATESVTMRKAVRARVVDHFRINKEASH